MKPVYLPILTLLLTALVFISQAQEPKKAPKTVPVRNIVSVWAPTSQPPWSEKDATEKPKWKNGDEDISPTNNIHYKLSDRLGDIKQGGDGDNYIGAVRFDIPEEAKGATKATFQFFVAPYAKNAALPSELEVRMITTSSPIAGPDGKRLPTWTPKTFRTANLPSSRYLDTVTIHEGWNSVDITLPMKIWCADSKWQHGLMFCSTEQNGKYCYVVCTGENSPRIVLE